MPRTKKKTPLSPTEEIPILPASPGFSLSSNSSPASAPLPPTPRKWTSSKTPFLTLEEKRKWLACILRDTSGQHQGYELALGDKFKALIEDNKLAGHPESEQETPEEKSGKDNGRGMQDLLQALLATVRPPHQLRFKDKP